MRLLCLSLILMAPLAQAQRDFLTADEVDQVRLAQEPDLRIPLYQKFAEQRISLLEQLFSQQKAGRSGMIHDTLEQYTQIIEAIDTFIDDALARKKPITSLAALTSAQRAMLAKLEKFKESNPADLERYQFVLDNAIDTTRDSIEMSEVDLKTRTREVESREAEIKREREQLMTPERKAEAQKKQETEKAAEKKKPSLYRKGEKEASQQKKQ
ncbi:MAG: hypothetical protein HXY18_07655 [Bryobacteraceae bacterium]|jgi:hypothetical protein|nr:hypothetical protein [Bryobacteraceae bacterium]